MQNLNLFFENENICALTSMGRNVFSYQSFSSTGKVRNWIKQDQQIDWIKPKKKH